MVRKTKNSKIEYGKVEIDNDEFDDKYKKIRITTFIDYDVYKALREEAEISQVGYQTILNNKLKESIFKKNVKITPLEEILKKIERIDKAISRIPKRKAS